MQKSLKSVQLATHKVDRIKEKISGAQVTPGCPFFQCGPNSLAASPIIQGKVTTLDGEIQELAEKAAKMNEQLVPQRDAFKTRIKEAILKKKRLEQERADTDVSFFPSSMLNSFIDSSPGL